MYTYLPASLFAYRLLTKATRTMLIINSYITNNMYEDSTAWQKCLETELI